MGMYYYFEANFKIDIKHKDVLDILKYLILGIHDKDEPKILPNHDFFKNERWWFIGRGSSSYFEEKESTINISDNVCDVFISCSLKCPFAIDLFMVWIMPFLGNTNGEYLGYRLYEEDEYYVYDNNGNEQTISNKHLFFKS